MEEAKISSKGQLVIPKYIRNALGWEEGSRVILSLLENKLVIMKKPDDPLDSLVKQGSKMGMKNIRREIKPE